MHRPDNVLRSLFTEKYKHIMYTKLNAITIMYNIYFFFKASYRPYLIAKIHSRR
jgi:hypothetical protein